MQRMNRFRVNKEGILFEPAQRPLDSGNISQQKHFLDWTPTMYHVVDRLLPWLVLHAHPNLMDLRDVRRSQTETATNSLDKSRKLYDLIICKRFLLVT